jgi:hypothetical protein
VKVISSRWLQWDLSHAKRSLFSTMVDFGTKILGTQKTMKKYLTKTEISESRTFSFTWIRIIIRKWFDKRWWFKQCYSICRQRDFCYNGE